MVDYAVVVGVARYPKLSQEAGLADLDGPNNDAQAVRDWLVDPQGGRLDPANVRLIRSAAFDPLDAAHPEPAWARIHDEMLWVEEQTRAAPAGRLYLYFSGHGFSPVLEEGALFTADARQISPSHVYAHAYLRWFRQAQRCHESVLWMDCCMNYQQSIPVMGPLMRIELGTGIPGPAFMAFAAQTGSALERKMSDGQVHGVFTWTLLQGLRGGACDERGRVTGESLKTFLHNVMPEFLPEAVKNSTAVDLQPFVRADQGMVFLRLAARPKHRVCLSLPTAVSGQEVKVWTGRPHAQIVSERLTGNEWVGELVRGLYVAEVPDAGLRQGFQVSGAGTVELAITRQGPPVVPADVSDWFPLDVVADNPAAAITVTDYRFERIFTETGQLHEREAPGVYKVRVEFGRDMAMLSDEVLLLDRDVRVARPLAPPQLRSPAPITGTASTHEYHEAPFSDAADRRGPFTAPAAGGAAISVIARYWTDSTRPERPTKFPHPMDGLQLVDLSGAPIGEPLEQSPFDDRGGVDPVATWERELPAGGYLLRQTLPSGRTLESPVVASPNWITQIAIRRGTAVVVGDGDVPHVGVIGDAAVFMRRAGGTARPWDQDVVIEAARMALTQGRDLFGEGRGAQLQELLLQQYDDPIAGIIGGHLLLRACQDSPDVDPARGVQFDAVVTNLRGLVGPEHPDVEALSLRCTDAALRATRPFTVPPMFIYSWKLITDASYESPELVPIELWQRVHASANVGPFFVWAADEDTRDAHAQQLSRWISKFPQPADARESARQLSVPAAAATVLWAGRSVPQQAARAPLDDA